MSHQPPLLFTWTPEFALEKYHFSHKSIEIFQLLTKLQTSEELPVDIGEQICRPILNDENLYKINKFPYNPQLSNKIYANNRNINQAYDLEYVQALRELEELLAKRKAYHQSVFSVANDPIDLLTQAGELFVAEIKKLRGYRYNFVHEHVYAIKHTTKLIKGEMSSEDYLRLTKNIYFNLSAGKTADIYHGLGVTMVLLGLGALFFSPFTVIAGASLATSILIAVGVATAILSLIPLAYQSHLRNALPAQITNASREGIINEGFFASPKKAESTLEDAKQNINPEPSAPEGESFEPGS